MENQQISTDRITVSEIGNNLEHDIQLVDPVEVEENAITFENKNHVLRNAAQSIRYRRGSGRNGHVFSVLLNIKKAYPDVDLKKFLELYVKDNNIDSIEYNNDMETAQKAEDYFFKKLRRKIKKLGRKVRKVVKKGAKFVKKGVKGVTKLLTGYTVLLPLRPFKSLMRKSLKKKGVYTSSRTSLIDVVTRFYKYVVKGKSKNSKGNFEELPDDWYYSDPMFQEGSHIEDYDEDHVAASAIAGIVGAVIGFIKKMIKKKKKGEKFTGIDATIESEVGLEGLNVQRNLEEKQAEELIEGHAKIQQKAGVLSNKNMMYILIGLVVFVLLRKGF